jgi:3-hydroxypropanoate dehydrogenase
MSATSPIPTDSYDIPVVPTVDQIVELKASRSLDERALSALFIEARTANGYLDRPVPRDLLARATEIALFGPTSANTLPMRLVFVDTKEGKERLRPAIAPGNVEKTMAAPVTAIVAADLEFYKEMPRTFPDRAEMFQGIFLGMEPIARRAAAWDNALLQMGYFIIAARSLGLDAGPMGGFERSIVDAEFFAEGRWASQYLINLGYGDDTKVFPRLPRFNVDEIARFA